ncbi:MAG: phosphotransferase enzyme family protein, partial [Pseudomonadales bacterium]
MTQLHERSSDDQFLALERLAYAALEQWDLDNPAIKLIKHRENTVYQVDADQGRFALRIHRYDYHPDSDIQTELDWILSLSEAGLPVPRPRLSKDGNLFEICQHGDMPEPRQVDIFSWAHGIPFGSVEDVLEGKIDRDRVLSCYKKAGALAARMHNHAENYELPVGGTRQAWDEDGLLGEEPLWGRGWENELLSPENREKILQVRETIRAKLTAFGKGNDRYGLIHCDFMPENLFVDGEEIEIIDFDDAGYGWHMFDFATALFFYVDTPV